MPNQSKEDGCKFSVRGRPSHSQRAPECTICETTGGVVQLLVREGARLHSRTSDNGTVVHYAASSGSAHTLQYILNRTGMSQGHLKDREEAVPAGSPLSSYLSSLSSCSAKQTHV